MPLAALPAAGAWLSPWSAARAGEPARGAIALNRLEERAEGCRVWLLLRNRGADAHEPTPTRSCASAGCGSGATG